jgi:phosphotransferase system enzyme I (PtsI)
MADRLYGLGASPGQAAGPAIALGPPPELPPEREVADPRVELALIERATKEVRDELTARAARATTGSAREVLEAQALLAVDPMMLDTAAERITAGSDAAHALTGAFAELRELLVSAGGMFAERAADLDDLSNRALAVLLDAPMPGIPEPGHPFVLVADDLAPADTAGLNPAVVLALVTERGGLTSHTAILARALGIPAVVGCEGALGLTGLVIVNGTTGEVLPGVTEEEAAEVNAQAETERRRLAASSGPTSTSDGHRVELMVNIGSVEDLHEVGDGVGLFRTEFLFLGRTQEPGLDEQTRAYGLVFAAAAGKPVIVRTLDAGADKPLPFLGLPDEPNPALGVRGLRTSRTRPVILDTQLRAIAQAARDNDAEVWVMAPMVSTVTEAAEFVALVRSHGLRTAGVMVEVPAAALHADRLLRSADFLSIGTNDLAQYTLAIDRQSGDLPDLLDPWQPALLELIAHCARAGRAHGKPVSVCGEAAADPLLAPVLVGLGIRKLSMSPRSLPAVREALARYSLAECERLAERVLEADDAAQARALAV